ncbi:MAG TPA: TIM barrel protein [Chthonomonadaceae bacterium]|nr:TIM barrel protein [Chthonomonadaceae bacterium]
MRLGGPVFGPLAGADEWVAALGAAGYRAAYCPVDARADDRTVRQYVEAAARADIVIAEVGAWSNPISPDSAVRAAAMERCREQLALADRTAARCCVNIAGSRSEQWDGPHPDNFTPDTFALIVDTVREIIDAVRPTRTYYALETMPWVFPDSPESYLDLIAAIDRPRFAVHLDPVNMISSPRRFFDNAGFIRDCFEKLGPHIKTCHAKDIALSGRLTIHLDEVRPGLGTLDYGAFLSELNRLDPDTPLMLEHLPSADEYALAAAHVRSVGLSAGIVNL